MKKGKKIYILEITFDDKTDEIKSIYESLEALNNDMALCHDGIESIDNSIESVCLSEIYDEESFDLIADANIIGSA